MNTANPTSPLISFIGGGNMASAIIGGLIAQGHPVSALQVVEPWDEQRARLAQQFPGMPVAPAASEALKASDLVVWAVKPQAFKEVTAVTCPFIGETLHLSVAAGITSDSMAHWLGSERIVRAMPNTPALLGLGMTGLFARAAATQADRQLVDTVVKATGDFVWVDDEKQLDAVTALSGSGPAYVYYFLEAMRDAGTEMGLPPELAQRLAMGTFAGATALAQQSGEPLQTMRERVTSKGGTTHAALTSMEASDIKALFQKAMLAAQNRAEELGKEFGG
ncbi:pyrroline-5-carboxylate reductase [Hydrogenophaga crassostreae]|uniref:Pyrroline-5-carboxylate reductase n=1 Tax=Hydrogenophaga crassostreae TaxID=1763535 RepID=A0A162P3L5_9BURK|nr:pyrroline-5-carboxylate reductase [Hydrogenophaga crassostreae]AOW12088.1 pyrroline-5-carboxylate reductase [Hydrogenophaga crassostreae]OAD41032.1 pyrroline-5-carboxylate reductase [Hydrogenophaga crassostreae]